MAEAAATVALRGRHDIGLGETLIRFDADGAAPGTDWNDDTKHGGYGTAGLFAQCGEETFVVTAGHLLIPDRYRDRVGQAALPHVPSFDFLAHSIKTKSRPRMDWAPPASAADAILEPAAKSLRAVVPPLPALAAAPAAPAAPASAAVAAAAALPPAVEPILQADVGVLKLAPEWRVLGGCSTPRPIPHASQIDALSVDHADLIENQCRVWRDPWVGADGSLVALPGYSINGFPWLPPAPAPEADVVAGGSASAGPGAVSSIAPDAWALALLHQPVAKTGARTGYTEGFVVAAGTVFRPAGVDPTEHAHIYPLTEEQFNERQLDRQRSNLIPGLFVVPPPRTASHVPRLFAADGDSGAAVVTSDTREYVGMVTSGALLDIVESRPVPGTVITFVTPAADVIRVADEIIGCAARRTEAASYAAAVAAKRARRLAAAAPGVAAPAHVAGAGVAPAAAAAAGGVGDAAGGAAPAPAPGTTELRSGLVLCP